MLYAEVSYVGWVVVQNVNSLSNTWEGTDNSACLELSHTIMYLIEAVSTSSYSA